MTPDTRACVLNVRLDPVIVNAPSLSDGKKMSCVSFAHNTDCILVGDSGGQLTVFQLNGLVAPHGDQVYNYRAT